MPSLHGPWDWTYPCPFLKHASSMWWYALLFLFLKACLRHLGIIVWASLADASTKHASYRIGMIHGHGCQSMDGLGLQCAVKMNGIMATSMHAPVPGGFLSIQQTWIDHYFHGPALHGAKLYKLSSSLADISSHADISSQSSDVVVSLQRHGTKLSLHLTRDDAFLAWALGLDLSMPFS